MTQYAGANWIKKSWPEIKMSPLGEAVADLLGDLCLGIYHLDYGQLHKTDWSNKNYIRFILGWKCLSTYDYNDLTVLVVLAHDRCIRVQISPYTFHHLELVFHQRQREGNYAYRHPTIEAQIELIRAHYSNDEVAIRAEEESQ